MQIPNTMPCEWINFGNGCYRLEVPVGFCTIMESVSEKSWGWNVYSRGASIGSGVAPDRDTAMLKSESVLLDAVNKTRAILEG